MEGLVLRQASRAAASIKMMIHGGSGSGKTYSALKIARGMVDDWSQVGIIDTENGSADLYAHFGNYQVITMNPPYDPKRFIQAVNLMYAAGIKVIIADSITHYWEHLKDLHDQHASRSGINEWTAWRAVTPLHRNFVDCILQTPVHFIATSRSRQEYSQVKDESTGKTKIVKMGMKPEARPGTDYEFTLVFRMEQDHKAYTDKDRTGEFDGELGFLPDESTGQKIREWCQGANAGIEDLRQRIFAAGSLQELQNLYHSIPTQLYHSVAAEFEARGAQLNGSAA